MDFQIEGGRKLTGTAVTKTSKNAAVVLLCASLLNKGQTTLKNMPRIEEVSRIMEVLQSIGVEVKWENTNDVSVFVPKKISLARINRVSAEKTRSIILFLGPLVHLFSSFKIPQAGGCKLGSRTVRPHLFALENFGVRIEATSKDYDVWVKKLKPAEVTMYESGDTATENAIMAAALISGKSTIRFAGSNYMVQELCFFLSDLGVKIEGIGTSTLIIHGVKEIKKDIVYFPSEDPIESMLFLAIAATTNSAFKIERCPIDFLSLELLKIEKMGFKYKISKPYKSLNGRTNLVDIETKFSKLTALEEKIHPLPYPGLNIDNLPFFVPIATQAKGKTLIHDWVYENRAIYYMELNKLGADIILADPHRVFIEGPTKLKATEIVCPPALRPAAIILISMLASEGTSILRNVYSIARGYEDLAERLNNLGASVKVLNK